MYTYVVTFRIADRTVNGKTYSDRYNQIVRNVRAEDGGFWDEPTSFFLVESSLSTPEFAKRTVHQLSAKYDMVLVFDPSDMSACYFGAVESEDVLLSFLPKAKKLE